MVRIPKGLHKQTYRPQRQGLAYRPGWQGTGMQRPGSVPVESFTSKVQGVPLTGGSQQGQVSAAGTCTLSVGPQGLGTIWYPSMLVLSTTTGPLDVSTALAYEGAQNVPITLIGTILSGNGNIALPIPSMAPGQYLIVNWTSAHPGDTAGMNVLGTMDALSV